MGHSLKGINLSKLLEICKNHLGNEWGEVDEANFDAKFVTDGMTNRLYVCSTKGCPEVGSAKVLIRFYGGSLAAPDPLLKFMSEAAEVLLFDRLHRIGLAPQLLGVFEGGRIEQFIESRYFSRDEFRFDEKVNDALARNLARYHATDFVVTKRPLNIVKLVKECLAKFRAIQKELPPMPSPATEAEAKELSVTEAFDYDAELEWLVRTMPKVHSRVVLCHHDVNRRNVLLKAEADKSLPLDQQILFIDYESSVYNHRGTDIGHHLTSRFMDYGHDNFRDPDRQMVANETQRRQFVRSYVDECKKIPIFQKDWKQDGVDSEDHIMMECELYSCAFTLLYQAWMLRDAMFYAKLEPKVDMGTGPAMFLYIYYAQKKIFLDKYPHMI